MPTATAPPNRINFTVKALEGIAPPRDADRVYVYDSSPKSPSGLALCVTSTGRKSFYLVGRFDGEPGRLKLGTFTSRDGAAGGLTIEQARKLAVTKAGTAASGIDVLDEARRRRGMARFGEVFKRFLAAPTRRTRRAKSARTVDDYQRGHDLYLAEWDGLRLDKITRGMVRKLHDKIAVTDMKPVQANRVCSLIGAVFMFAITREDMDVPNPALGFEKADEQARVRRLSADELGPFVRAIKADDRQIMVDAALVALYTAQRCGNVLSAEWSEMDLDAKVWTIPAAKTKTRRDYTVYLAPQVLAILSRRKLKAPDGVFVFPGRRHGRHMTTLRYIVEAASKATGIKDLDVHDLRRTARSIIGDTGTPGKYASLVTAHTTGKGMSAIYDRADEPLARLAFNLLADAIDATVAGDPLPQWADCVAKLHKADKGVKRG